MRHTAHLFLRHANERARGGIPLKTTAPAARAGLSVLMENDVPDLRACAAEALKQLSAENDAAADARSERQKDTARILPAGTIACLAERRRVGIVQNKGLFARIFLHERRKRYILPAEICPGSDHAVRAVHNAGRADADRLNIVHALIGFLRRLQNELRQRDSRLLRRIGCGRLHARFSLQLIADKQRRLGRHAAQINAYDHNLLPLGIYIISSRAAIPAGATQVLHCPQCAPKFP